MQNWLIPLGGLLTGSGVVALIFGFEVDTGRAFHTSFSEIGYTGIGQFGLNGLGVAALGLILVGLAMMIFANRTAWTQTGGY